VSSRSRFEFGPGQLAQLNMLLQQYEGTHNFHNYTVSVEAD
jgi:tRNA U38,U39,U40 pseudouridine synthase TruA